MVGEIICDGLIEMVCPQCERKDAAVMDMRHEEDFPSPFVIICKCSVMHFWPEQTTLILRLEEIEGEKE